MVKPASEPGANNMVKSSLTVEVLFILFSYSFTLNYKKHILYKKTFFNTTFDS